MKSIVKTILTVSALLPLAGCLDFGWSKKESKQEQGQAPMHHESAEKKADKCSHKGCAHDHSKDGKKHAGKHKDGVKVQDFDEENDDNFGEDDSDAAYQDAEIPSMDEDDDADVETQGMDDEEDDDDDNA